jgi:ketosteroid isomerase-like protein
MLKKPPFKNVDAAYAKAFNIQNAAGIAALYSKDAIFMMPDEPAKKGTKGIKELAQTAFDAGWRNVKFKTIKSGSDGNLAFAVGTVAMDQPSGDGTVKVKGKYIDVYQRQKDGSWKIVATCYNADAPAKPAQ